MHDMFTGVTVDRAVCSGLRRTRETASRVLGERTLEVFRGTPELRDGYMWPNEKPGLGIDIDEELALKFPHDPHAGGQFDNVRRADGTVVTP